VCDKLKRLAASFVSTGFNRFEGVTLKFTQRVFPAVSLSIFIFSLFFILAARETTASPVAEMASPLILTVNSNLDDSDVTPGDGVCLTRGGVCTLRAALEETNATPNTAGTDEIRFNLSNSGSKPYEIKPTAAFPFITDPVVMDATTQPGYAGVPLVVLQGIFRPEDGLNISAGSTTIRGFKILSFRQNGIYIHDGGSNVIQGNYIGTDGTQSLGNQKDGIRIENSSGNLVGGTTAGAGNVIVGNSNTGGSGDTGFAGIYILGSSAINNSIQGNIIGLLPDGKTPGGNRWGILIKDSTNTQIGGTTAEARNIISGNHADGIMMTGTGPLNTIIEGNYIGTDITGKLGRGNNGSGVFIPSSVSAITIGGDVGVTPGGPCTGACNVISSNYSNAGIRIQGGQADSITIRGNYIGTDVTGTVGLGLQRGGLYFASIRNSTIGGDAPGTGNLISGNEKEGITFEAGHDNVIQGNLIGTDITGSVKLGNEADGIAMSGLDVYNNRIENNIISGNNQRGIELSSNAHDIVIRGNRIGVRSGSTQSLPNLADGIIVATGANHIAIGGLTPADQNIIAYNGVGVNQTGVSNITILGNSIFSNAGLGISGAEYTYNFRIDDVRVGVSTDVAGLYNSSPNQTYRLEFFSNDTCDASDTGEGQTFLYASSVTTDANGDAPFNITLPPAIAANEFITMTATANDGSGGTTQFSRCAAVIEADLAISKVVNQSTRNEGDTLTYTLTVTNNGPDAASNIQVQDQLPASVTYASDDGAGPYNPATGIWTIPSLAKNATKSLTINTSVNASTLNTTFTNTASIINLDQKDPYRNANQSSGVTVAVGTNVGVTISADKRYPRQGDTVTFTIQTTNSGPGDATSVHIQDILPTGITYQSSSATQGSYIDANGDWDVGTLAKNSIATLTLTAQVNNGIPNQVVENTASVSNSDYADPNPANNSANVTLAIGGTDLSIAQSADHSTVDEGDTLVYTITATNIGPNSTDNVTVNDLLPTGLSYVSSTASAGSYNPVSGVWDVGSLGVSGTATLQLTATVNAGTGNTTLTNNANIVSASSNDLNAANNQAQVAINIRPAFTCAKLQMSNVSISGSTVVWTLVNDNPQATQLTRSYLVWNTSDLANVPGAGLVSQSINGNVFWQGNDTVSPTDSTNSGEGTFDAGANRAVSGGSSVNVTAAFSNLHASLAYYLTQWNLSGTTLYFDDPKQPTDCAIPLTLPTRPPIYTVTTTADTNDGACDGQCSLREAVIAANANPGATIVIPAGTYTFTRSGANEDNAATGDLDLRANMTITGAGTGVTIINGGGIDRVFHVFSAQALIKNLTIRNGNATEGGGLYNTFGGNSVLLNVVVSNNTVTGNGLSTFHVSGGGIANSGGTLTIISSDIHDNQSINLNAGGGGIANMGNGRLTIIDSAVHLNTAYLGAGIGADGIGSTGAVSVTGSTIYNNTGAGIYNAYHVFTLTNSTISGNSDAGIIQTNNASGSMQLTQATITNNASGINRSGPFARFYARNTIIAGNNNEDCVLADINSQGYNLIGTSSGCGFPISSSTDMLDVNPLLSPLANNGGATLTHAPQAGSPALDAIPAAQCAASVDQRSIQRPQGIGCDIGAFEVQGPSGHPMVFRVNSFVDTGDGKIAENETTTAHITQLLVTFSAIMADPAGDSAANDVTNLANYRLLTPGANHAFETTTCTDPAGDDTTIVVNSVYYDYNTFTANLDVNNNHFLPAGDYRLLVCGTLEDTQGRQLDGNADGTGGDAFRRNFAVSIPAGAFTLNSTTDAVDSNPGDGICATAANACTLRAAIMESNAHPGPDTISVPPGNYALTQAGQDEDAAATGDLDITDTVTILGADAATTIVDGGALDRVFHITGNFTVAMSDLTIRNGQLTGGQGGGIFNVTGRLTLTNVVVTQNQAGTGGGLNNSLGGKVIFINSAISENSGSGIGGGILNDIGSQLDISNSLITGNSTDTSGGGIYNQGSLFNLVNSTVTDNHAPQGDGGGIYSNGSGQTNIRFSTIVHNSAQNYGGGVTAANTGVVVNLTANILAQNTSNLINEGSCGINSLHSNGYNISDDYSCRYVLTGGGDQILTNPRLGALGNYGGFTSTFNVLLGSPAIDAVAPNLCTVTVDQRGISRPKGMRCDIGSYELVPAAPPAAPDGLALSNITAASIMLNWTDNSSDENAFSVERSPDGSNWQEITQVGANVTTYVDNAVVCDSTYSYRVRSYRSLDGAYSSYSTTATASMPFCLTTDLSLTMNSNPPNVPQGSNFDYTLMVSNTGPNPAPNVEIKAALPSGTWPTSAEASQGQYNLSGGVWAVGPLDAGSSATLTIHTHLGSGVHNSESLLATAEITKAGVNDSDSMPNNHDPQEDDWAQTGISVACAASSVFSVADGDVDGLKVAIEAANDNTCYPGMDTITLASNGHYTLTAVYGQQTGLPTITQDLTIHGNSATIERDGSLNTPRFRLLRILSGASVRLTDITLQGGFSTFDNDMNDYNQNGGAVLNEGILNITRSNLINNSANKGGAIANHNGTLTVTDTTFSQNHAVGYAGGILNDGNTATAIVSGTTFDHNTSGRAGALVNLFGQMTVTNSTFFQNSSSYLVDGVETEYGTLKLVHNTFFTTVPGTNVTLYFVSSTVQLRANLIKTPQTKICDGVGALPISQGYNITNGSSLCAVAGIGDKTKTDPQLDSFGSYGGLTRTMKLLANSPALDAVPAVECTVNVDQRGISRPQFNGCDSGAFEADSLSSLIPLLISPTDNAEFFTNPPTLTWLPVNLADHYELQIGTANPPASEIIPISSTAFTTSKLSETTYFWRIRAIDKNGNATLWSAIWKFTIASPANGAPPVNLSTTATPTLTWSLVSWATGYELQIDTEASFQLPYADQQQVDAATLSYTTRPLTIGTYYWRIRAKKQDGTWGSWSHVESFTIASP
jgi:uncharacterized repeat protein (TIGR01451 family)/CSLREA domain-containing protein